MNRTDGVLGAGCRVLGVVGLAMLVSAHIGSPDVFFSGKAGPYDIKVVVRPPEVVPGVARVTVQAPAGVTSVSIRPVFWRAGSKGSPPPDAMRRIDATSTFEGSLWLMASGAYSVDVIVEGSEGTAKVFVPVASVATGRLALDPKFGAFLAAVGVFLVVGLVNIVRKAAGESLIEPGRAMDAAAIRTSRVAGAAAFAVLALAVFGGSRWWRAVDADYERSIYVPAKLPVSLRNGALYVDALGRFVPDHGKLMHLFMVKAEDARGFAHLHPQPVDTAQVPAFVAAVPPLPAGTYHVYADVVQQTGFERTLVASLVLGADEASRSGTQAPAAGERRPKADADDAWFVGDATRLGKAQLADGSTMLLTLSPSALAVGNAVAIGVSVTDPNGRPARLEPYLGMPAHAVVVRLDGTVYVHLHTMGTVTQAAQDVFLARDRGDTTEQGVLRLATHAAHQPAADRAVSSAAAVPSVIEFPYAFPRAGEYRLFVQVKRGGRVLTGAFAVTIADSVVAK